MATDTKLGQMRPGERRPSLLIGAVLFRHPSASVSNDKVMDRPFRRSVVVEEVPSNHSIKDIYRQLPKWHMHSFQGREPGGHSNSQT